MMSAGEAFVGMREVYFSLQCTLSQASHLQTEPLPLTFGCEGIRCWFQSGAYGVGNAMATEFFHIYADL